MPALLTFNYFAVLPYLPYRNVEHSVLSVFFAYPYDHSFARTIGL